MYKHCQKRFKQSADKGQNTTLSCSAVFLLFKIWKKAAKNCPIFLGPDPTSTKSKAEKKTSCNSYASFVLSKLPACILNSIYAR